MSNAINQIWNPKIDAAALIFNKINCTNKNAIIFLCD